jgi:hypothetical protein
MYTINSTQPKCSVNITTNRNRVKSYNGKVYLKDGQKFELEIFNPYSFKVMAKVKFNGHYISESGIVINPGQRIYLERYLDSNNAFLFSTYEIDGTVEALKAIAENGNIEVDFYTEYIPSGTFISTNVDWTYRPNQIIYTTHDAFPYIGGNSSVTCNYSSNINETIKGSLETGRVEKGEETKQTFENDNTSFNVFVSESVTIKMLPTSAKPTEVAEIRNYCTGCGTRIKKATWKFCPSCGEKL